MTKPWIFITLAAIAVAIGFGVVVSSRSRASSPMSDQFVTLDLREEFADVYAYLRERVRSYDQGKSIGPGSGGAVKRIDVGYEYAQSGWVAVVFDTREAAEPDGEWTLYLDGNCLDRPNWTAAGDIQSENGLRLILLDGSTRIVSPQISFELAIPLGEMIKAVLIKARADGLFAGLPKQARCELGVEHSEGTYGWPQYEDRGRENLAEPGAPL